MTTTPTPQVDVQTPDLGEFISESKAAETLGVPRVTLALWRRKGLINPQAFSTKRPIGPRTVNAPKAYDRTFITAIATGTRDQDDLFKAGDAA